MLQFNSLKDSQSSDGIYGGQPDLRPILRCVLKKRAWFRSTVVICSPYLKYI